MNRPGPNLLQMPHRCPESMWTERELTPRRPNGAYNNGPDDSNDRVARGIAVVVFVVALVGLGACLCSAFSGAETAAIQTLRGK